MSDRLPECDVDFSRPEDFVHGIFVSMESGAHLIRYTQDPKLNTELLSSFIAGLFLFGKESVGCIKEISIKGLNMEMLIVYKHGLILCAIFSEDMIQTDLQMEAERVLDIFFDKYRSHLPNWNGDLTIFQDFQLTIQKQVEKYFQQLRQSHQKVLLNGDNLWDRLIGALQSQKNKK